LVFATATGNLGYESGLENFDQGLSPQQKYQSTTFQRETGRINAFTVLHVSSRWPGFGDARPQSRTGARGAQVIFFGGFFPGVVASVGLT
jgi:hypothetical protein